MLARPAATGGIEATRAPTKACFTPVGDVRRAVAGAGVERPWVAAPSTHAESAPPGERRHPTGRPVPARPRAALRRGAADLTRSCWVRPQHTGESVARSSTSDLRCPRRVCIFLPCRRSRTRATIRGRSRRGHGGGGPGAEGAAIGWCGRPQPCQAFRSRLRGRLGLADDWTVVRPWSNAHGAHCQVPGAASRGFSGLAPDQHIGSLALRSWLRRIIVIRHGPRGSTWLSLAACLKPCEAESATTLPPTWAAAPLASRPTVSDSR